MIRLFIRHPVADFDAWKQGYDDFDADRSGMGVLGHGVFRSTDDPNDVTVWHDFDSLESARAFMNSRRLKDVMASAGVAGEPAAWTTRRA